jgi:Uma2 family endonuclease
LSNRLSLSTPTTPAEMLLEQQETEELAEMPSLEHGAIGVRLRRYLGTHVEDNGLGVVCDSQTSYKFVGQNSTCLPDLSFVSRDRLPQQINQNADFAPDLAVEVLSRGDDVAEVDHTILQYQRSRVRLVWHSSCCSSDRRLSIAEWPQIVAIAH